MELPYIWREVDKPGTFMAGTKRRTRTLVTKSTYRPWAGYWLNWTVRPEPQVRGDRAKKLPEALDEGLVRSGRFMTLRMPLPDDRERHRILDIHLKPVNSTTSAGTGSCGAPRTVAAPIWSSWSPEARLKAIQKIAPYDLPRHARGVESSSGSRHDERFQHPA